MVDYTELMERADRAMYDVAQLHLDEFGADRDGVDPATKWGADGGRSSASDPKGPKPETTEERGLNGVNPANAD